MSSKPTKIEINFPIPVEITSENQLALHDLLEDICKKNCPEDCVMWHSESGSKITYIPMTREEEKVRGMEFDDNILSLSVSLRKKQNGEE